MSSPPSFSSIVRFVVFFLCDESRDVIRMHKSESHLARTQKPSLMQVVPLHLLLLSGSSLLSIWSYDHTTILVLLHATYIHYSPRNTTKKKVHQYHPIRKVDEEKSAATFSLHFFFCLQSFQTLFLEYQKQKPLVTIWQFFMVYWLKGQKCMKHENIG